MYCINCGSQVNDDDKFCLRCGAVQKGDLQPNQVVIARTNIAPQPVAYEKTNTPEDNHLANVLCIISLCLYFVLPGLLSGIYAGLESFLPEAVSLMIGFLDILSFLAAYVLMIIARVKCPKSTFAKVVMWIYIALLILGILTWIIIFAACGACIAASGR